MRRGGDHPQAHHPRDPVAWSGQNAGATRQRVPKRVGPVSVDLTAFSRSLPSAYQLLPEYAAIGADRDHLKTTETTVPELDTIRLADAMAFHTDLQAAEATRPASVAMTHAIVGTRQPPGPRSP